VRDTDFVSDPMKPERCGPGHIMHDEPVDRPREGIGGNIRLHGGGDYDSFPNVA
jgi:hypothetical protein